MKKRNGDTRIVCFDLGGVIVRICRSWEEACARVGLPVRGEAAGEGMKTVRRAITKGCTVGELDEAVWVERIVESLDGLYSVDEIKRIHDGWLIEEYPGWGALIAEIRETGLITACLSNTVAGHWRRLINIDDAGRLRHSREAEFPSILFLDAHFASHLLGVAKPSEDIYREFERGSGFSGEAILFFDDLIENIEGARAAGWNAEQIDHTGSPVDQVRKILDEYGLSVES